MSEDSNVKRQIALSSTGLDMSTAAVLSKVEKNKNNNNNGKFNNDGTRDFPAFINGYADILNSRARKNRDNEIALSLLPDTKAAINILSSSILSPSEMMESKIIVNNNSTIESDLKSSMNLVVSDYLENDYQLNLKTSKMLEDILAKTGSYVVAVLPESAVDHMINKVAVGTESISTGVNNFYTNYKINIEKNSQPSEFKCIKPKGILSNVKASQSNGLSLALNNLMIDKPKTSYSPFISYSAESIISAHNKACETLGVAFEAKSLPAKDVINQDATVAIIDNTDALKMRSLINAGARKRQSELAEGDPDTNTGRYKGLGNIIQSAKIGEIDAAVFGRKRVSGFKVIASLPKQNHLSRQTYGEPLILKLPSESVLPVYVPGDKEHHLGAFVMVDIDGNPVDMSDMNRCCSNLNRPLNQQSNNRLSNMLNTVDNNINSHTRQVSAVSNFTTVMYEEIIERELIDRVKNGIGINEVNIAKNTDFYRVMLARSLSNNFTQLLYMPAEYVTYMAFDYDANGLGASLMDSLSTVNMLRAMLLYNDVIASVKNSTQRTQVDVNIDAKDPDPMKTASMIMDNLVRARSLDLSRMSFDQNDITNVLQRAGYEWNFTGHPKLPETKTTINTTQTTIPKSDQDLNDSLKKASNFGIGVPPEMVDNSFQSEFAITSILNNTMFGKLVIGYQTKFSAMLSDHVRKIATADGNIYNKLKDIAYNFFDGIAKESDALQKMLELFKNNIPDYDFSYITKIEDFREIYVRFCVDCFIVGIKIDLPRPPSVTVKAQIEELSDHLELVDAVLDQIINTEFLTADTQGELSSSVDTIKAMIKSQICRDYISSKGIMPEIMKITNPSEGGSKQPNVLDNANKYIEMLSKAGIGVKIKNAANSQATDQILKSMGDAGVVTDTPSDTQSEDPTDDPKEGDPIDELEGKEGDLVDPTDDGLDTSKANGKDGDEGDAPAGF
jgi:hypothetical protein